MDLTNKTKSQAAATGSTSAEEDERKAHVKRAMSQLAEAQRVLDYDTKEFTIELLVQKFGDGKSDDADIYVPAYQRRFNWEIRRQSRFIESVLLGLPVPFLFFGEADDGRYEVVDGMQRLSTCSAFQNNTLELVGLERIDLLDGCRFRDLSEPQQRKFKNRTIRSVVLSDRASPDDRRDLFDRINTSSLIAEPSEIRRGAIGGTITDLIDKLAADKRFVKICPMTDAARKRREGEELITRFFAFGEGLNEYRDRIGEFLDDWVKAANRRAKDDASIVADYRARFHRVMKFVDAHFPFGFRKTPDARTSPRVRFDAIAVGAYLALVEQPALDTTGPKIRPQQWLDEDDFRLLTTSGSANVKSKIENRIQYVKHMLLGEKKQAKGYAP